MHPKDIPYYPVIFFNDILCALSDFTQPNLIIPELLEMRKTGEKYFTE
jgi:hypothetical protein